MIAVIPAAGLGTRFLPLTRVIPKEMLPVGEKPAIAHLVDEARAAGAERVIIVISPKKELVREYFRDDPTVEFVYQAEQRGLGDAVLAVEREVLADGGGEKGELLILLGDAIVLGCAASSEMAAVSRSHGHAAVIGCERVPREKVSRYGIMALKDGVGPEIVDLVEKPDLAAAPSDLAVAGRYLLPRTVFRYLRTQTPGKGGEIQLTDAIRRMLAETRVLAYVYPGRRYDLGNPAGYFETLKGYYHE